MKIDVKRMDHLGIVAGTIRDLKIIEMIDERIPPDPREHVTTGESIAAMVINSLGFFDTPLSLTPHFFQSKAVERLIRPGAEASCFNRFKLSRSLDDCYRYGCDTLFAEISWYVCQKEGIDCRFLSEDTTSFNVTGEYDRDSDQNAIEIVHGHSKDHRPDLKQGVLELMTAHDGGVPLISRAWNGNASDNEVFQKRAEELLEAFKESKALPYLIADSKLYSKKNLEGPLQVLPFVTRVPGTLRKEKEVIAEAITEGKWEHFDEQNQYISREVMDGGVTQRWIVVYSREMQERTKKTLAKRIEKEKKEWTCVLSRHAQKAFSCRQDAQNSLKSFKTQPRFHTLDLQTIQEKKVYRRQGRPAQGTKPTTQYYAVGAVCENEKAIEQYQEQGSCYVLASNIPQTELSNREIIEAYKRHNASVERGFRFLKDPMFFASSFFVKKKERFMALLFVMTLSLLVYSVAQRRLRRHLQAFNKTLPNQINREIQNPTLRWIFQLMEGVELVIVYIGKMTQITISGMTELKRSILEAFPKSVQMLYGLTEEATPAL